MAEIILPAIPPRPAFAVRPTMAPTPETPGNKGVKVIMVEGPGSVPGPQPEPVTEIGTVTISPDNSAASVMGNQTFTAVVTGGDATDLAYKWTVRSGNAQLDTPGNQASATYTFIRDGSTQIQCAVSSANSSNSPQSNIAFVVVSA